MEADKCFSELVELWASESPGDDGGGGQVRAGEDGGVSLGECVWILFGD